ncbi:MAG TPA: choice-of-anchor tandem repeat GloVer-containing protein [Rhizomicrobium sp.]|nr:choice-of-anchor tandem repeat GloVer-containing protein [Rhizomicrobium sp.]
MNRIVFGAVGAMILSIAFCASPVNSATETVVYSFCSQVHKSTCTDGEYPTAVIDGNGTLYGAAAGGTCGNGTVFALDPQTGTLTTLHSFCKSRLTGDGSGPNRPTYSNGTLYGTTGAGGLYPPEGYRKGGGTIFSIDLATGSETIDYEFPRSDNKTRAPGTALLELSGIFYGIASGGGGTYCGGDCGTVFAFNPGSGTESEFYRFCGQPNCTDGTSPFAKLNHVNGLLYGTTYMGGAHFAGAVFSLNPGTGAESVVYSFCSQRTRKINCTDGSSPFASVVGLNGYLYGTTAGGGAYGYGTVFSINLETGSETVLHSFGKTSSDGMQPRNALLKSGSLLYGTTVLGGDPYCDNGSGCGTVFSIDPTTGAEKVLYSFGVQPSDGQFPYGELIEMNGALYGTTSLGGAQNAGTVFATTP